MSDVTIARATEADVADLAPLLAIQLDEHGMSLSKSAIEHALRGIVTNPHRGRILVARKDDAVIGFAVMPFTWTVEHGGLCAWLDELYVIPEMREHGVGTKLLLAAMKIARGGLRRDRPRGRRRSRARRVALPPPRLPHAPAQALRAATLRRVGSAVSRARPPRARGSTDEWA